MLRKRFIVLKDLDVESIKEISGGQNWHASRGEVFVLHTTSEMSKYISLTSKRKDSKDASGELWLSNFSEEKSKIFQEEYLRRFVEKGFILFF